MVGAPVDPTHSSGDQEEVAPVDPTHSLGVQEGVPDDSLVGVGVHRFVPPAEPLRHVPNPVVVQVAVHRGSETFDSKPPLVPRLEGRLQERFRLLG